MKKIWITSIALLLTTSSFSQNEPVTTFKWDISFFGFFNDCAGEGVRPLPGETIQAKLRLDATSNSVHFINHANGRVRGRGVLTGDAYSITISMAFFPGDATQGNIVDGYGAVNFYSFIQLTNLDNPSTDISRAGLNVRIVLQDGVVNIVHLESFSRECVSRE